MTYAAAILLGVAAGVLAGLFGVGGGILFVPVLVALGLSQHEATGTSLLAIVRWRAALVIGVAAAVAAQGGAFLAESLPERLLRRMFAIFLVLVAIQIAWRALHRE
jgi:uncharacterized membrane protein YfcA